MRRKALPRISILPALLLAASLAVTAGALAASGPPAPGPDYSPLGKGSVRMSFLQAPGGDVVLELTTDLEPVVGLVVEAGGKNLAVIASGEAAGRARGELASLEAEARLEIAGGSLAGQRPQIVLSSDLEGVHEVRLTLIGRDGAAYPQVFQSDDFRGTRITSSFTGAGGACRTITLQCSSGCTKTETCCSLLSCSVCRTCEILCGQSCLPTTAEE